MSIDQRERMFEEGRLAFVLERIKEKLYSFYPSAAYAVSRKNTSVPPEFQKFIETNMKLAVKDPKHFKGFVEHFQSVVAYFKEKDNRLRR